MRSRNGEERTYSPLSPLRKLEPLLYRVYSIHSYRALLFVSTMVPLSLRFDGVYARRKKERLSIFFNFWRENFSRFLFKFLRPSLIIIFLSLFQKLPSATREIFAPSSSSTFLISKNRGGGGGEGGKIKEIAQISKNRGARERRGVIKKGKEKKAYKWNSTSRRTVVSAILIRLERSCTRRNRDGVEELKVSVGTRLALSTPSKCPTKSRALECVVLLLSPHPEVN